MATRQLHVSRRSALRGAAVALVPCDVHRIEAADPYPYSYDAAVAWNVRASMIMTTFAEGYDFAGKSIHPVTTHAMSGLGSTVRDYGRSCPGATIGEGLAVKGEEVRNAGAAIQTWLQRTQLLQAQ